MNAVTGGELRLDEGYALFSEEANRSRPVAGVNQTLTFADIHSFKRVALQPSTFAPAFSQIDTFAQLGDDWDSYGARAITHEAADAARAILHRLHDLSLETLSSSLAPYHATPSPDGGVGLEWRREGQSIELWIGADGSLSAVIEDTLANLMQQRSFGSSDAAIATIESVVG